MLRVHTALCVVAVPVLRARQRHLFRAYHAEYLVHFKSGTWYDLLQDISMDIKAVEQRRFIHMLRPLRNELAAQNTAPVGTR